MFIGTGPAPTAPGSTFNASIGPSSNILTVYDFVTPSSQWPILAGMFLSGPGFNPVTITGLVSQTQTVTFTNGSASIGWTNTLIPNQAVQFTTTGSLPTNFTPNTPYYVIPTGLSGTTAQVTAAPDLGNPVTFTNGSASIGWTNTMVAGQAVYFSTSGALPTNFTQNVIYYVLATGLSGSNVEVGATPGGTPIVAGSAGSGAQKGFGNTGPAIQAGSAGSGTQTSSGISGGAGTYALSGGSLTIAKEEMFAGATLPGGATAITPAMNQTACTAGFTITSIAGVFTGAPNTQYWVNVAISTSVAGNQAQWENSGVSLFTY
jgi:hypothetical protein